MDNRSMRHNPLPLIALVALVVGIPAEADQGPAKSSIEAALGGSHSSNDTFLSPDEAFRFDALADGPDHIRLTWRITEGYYLYKARIKVSSSSDRAQLGELALPAGEVKVDDYFGKQEVYHHDIVGSVPVARAGGAYLD